MLLLYRVYIHMSKVKECDRDTTTDIEVKQIFLSKLFYLHFRR